jgi:hypothetical protein
MSYLYFETQEPKVKLGNVRKVGRLFQPMDRNFWRNKISSRTLLKGNIWEIQKKLLLPCRAKILCCKRIMFHKFPKVRFGKIDWLTVLEELVATITKKRIILSQKNFGKMMCQMKKLLLDKLEQCVTKRQLLFKIIVFEEATGHTDHKVTG